MRRLAFLLASLAAPLAAQQFVAELDAGPAQAFEPNPSHAIAGNGLVYFTADAPGFGRELHVTDGTVAGTRVFVDAAPGPLASNARAIGFFGSRVVVHAASRLLITDGTVAGTQTLLTGVNTQSRFRWVGATASRFVWADAPTSTSPWTLRSSDGTQAGTTSLGPIPEISGSIARNGRITMLCETNAAQVFSTDGVTITPIATLSVRPRSGFAALGAYDYFLVEDPSAQTTMWRTDGTTPGTTFVTSLGATQGPSTIAALGSQLVVGAADRLWTSDGTFAGTSALPVTVSNVRSLTRAGNVLCFENGSPSLGTEQLWRTDGTAAGTYVLDASNAVYTSFSVGTGHTVCLAVGAFPLRVIRTDGTTAGTTSMAIVDNGSYTSVAALGNVAIATVSIGTPGANTGLHAFATDATPAGSVQLTQSTIPAGVTAGGRGAAIESQLYFPAATAAYGYELWRTDGTQAGTQLVQDFAPGPTGGVREVVAYQGAVWISAVGAIWRNDGSGAPSTLVLQPDPTATTAYWLEASDDYLLFRTTDGSSTRLWRSDGTPSGTVLLQAATAMFQVIGVTAQVGDLTYWNFQEYVGLRLMRSNGTQGSVVDYGPSTFLLGVLGDRVVFGRSMAGGYEIRVATSATTTSQLVGTTPSPPSYAFPAGSGVVVVTANGQTFFTDLVSPLSPLPIPNSATLRFSADGWFYTGVYDPAQGLALWRTDGTPAGTAPVLAFGPSTLGSVFEAEVLGAGNRVWIQASDGVRGAEPWISSGTPATTSLLGDVEPNGSSTAQLVGIAGERAYFTAFDSVRGRELWSFDLATTGASNAQPFGIGCPGTFGVPRLRVDGVPAIGRSIAMRIERGAPSSIGLWFVGLGPQHLAVGGGCEFLMTTIAWSDWAFTDAAGAASTSLFVPNDPVFVGLPVVAQGSCLDPLGVSSFGTTVTEGVLMVLGG